MSEPEQPPPPGPAEWRPPSEPVRVVLPGGAEEALVVGPGDMLVIRVRSTVPDVMLTDMSALIAAGPLAGRVLLVAAEQIAKVIRA